MQPTVTREPGRSIAVLRALPGIGDLLCAVPALRAIRRAEPTARVAYVGLESTRSLVARFGAYVDEFIAFPGYPGLPEVEPDVAAIPGFLRELQGRRFDVALNLHGSGFATNPLVALFGARQTAGYHRAGEWQPAEIGFLLHDDRVPEVLRWLRLCAALGWPSDDTSLEFPFDPDADSELVDAVRRTGPYALVHPGSSIASRRWPVEAFAAVADALADSGIQIVLTGTTPERDVTGAVAATMRATPLDVAGRTSIDGLASLIRSAAVVVTNDTGTSHLADALRVPSVVAFVDSEVERWAPLDRVLHRRVTTDSAAGIASARAAALGFVRTIAGRSRDAA